MQQFRTWPRRLIALSTVCVFGSLLLVDQARAATMHVMESRPAAEAVMDGRQTEFFIRFDGPVDHAASVLTVLQDGRVVQVLHPRLNSQPNILYSGVSPSSRIGVVFDLTPVVDQRVIRKGLHYSG
jgi:methionine-rich copper-binding protein CopC